MTNYKQLCVELVELGSSPARSVSELAERMSQVMDLADRARAALAEPASEGPTDEELWELYQGPGTFSPVEFARDVLARWGNHPGSPDRSAQPEPEWPTDEELDLLADCHMITDGETGAVSLEHLDYARAVLARWGKHPGFPDSSPQPVPVSERLPGPGDTDPEGRCWWWYPEVPGKTYGYWAYEDDAVPERALNEQPTHWLSVHALPQPS